MRGASFAVLCSAISSKQTDYCLCLFLFENPKLLIRGSDAVYLYTGLILFTIAVCLPMVRGVWWRE